MASIPIGNTHEQQYFGPCNSLSQFQHDHILSLSQQEDFDFFCGNPYSDEPEKPYKGPVAVLFILKDSDTLYCHIIGRSRLLREVKAD